ncbi:MAG: glyoxalase [Anaerolineales bacterium]|nr:glyoxalase [Anaerolineales bacterium]
MTIQGLHHITLVCSDAQRTIDFYTQVLGQRLVKKTVNFDDPGSYHLYFGDEMGRPGSAITFFEWPGAPKGHWGIGGTHHFALTVPDYNGLLKWKRRLTDYGLSVDGPLDRHYFKSIYFTDPDGAIIEIATQGPGWTMDEAADKLGTEYRQPPPEWWSTTATRHASKPKPGPNRSRRLAPIWPCVRVCTILPPSALTFSAPRPFLATCWACAGSK